MSSTLIVYFLIGVLPPPIVMSLLSYGLATFDSNLSLSAFFLIRLLLLRFLSFSLFHLAAFSFFPFRFFALFFAFRVWFFATVGCVIMRLPKPITLRVGRKLAHKSKDEIMSEVLRVFAGLEVKAIQVAYEVVRVTFATPEHFRASKSYSGKHLFGLWCSILGAAPLLRACTSLTTLLKRMTYHWRLLLTLLVRLSPLKSRPMCLTPTSLMVPS